MGEGRGGGGVVSFQDDHAGDIWENLKWSRNSIMYLMSLIDIFSTTKVMVLHIFGWDFTSSFIFFLLLSYNRSPDFLIIQY